MESTFHVTPLVPPVHPRRLHPLLTVAAVSLTVFSLLGIATLTGVITPEMSPNLNAGRMLPAVPTPQGGEAAKADCARCGAVEAIRELRLEEGGGASPAGAGQSVYRITVHMDDGAYRTLSQSHLPAVMVGDKVKVVNGSVSAIP